MLSKFEFQIAKHNRSDGGVDRTPASAAVDAGSIPVSGKAEDSRKIGNHNFPAWRSTLKGDGVETKPHVRLWCPWERHLTGFLQL